MSNLQLVHAESGEPVLIGEVVTDFRGDKATVSGWQEPHHAGSTGRVYTYTEDSDIFHAQGFFPSVYGLKWVEQDEG